MLPLRKTTQSSPHTRRASDDFPTAAKGQAAADLTTAAMEGDLSIPVGDPFDLADAAKAHDAVDQGARDRVLVTIPD